MDLATLSINAAPFTITTENGDTLVGTYTGIAPRVPGSQSKLMYYVSGPITSGTGRFAGLGGAIAFFGSADLATGEFSDIVVGSYLQSRRQTMSNIPPVHKRAGCIAETLLRTLAEPATALREGRQQYAEDVRR